MASNKNMFNYEVVDFIVEYNYLYKFFYMWLHEKGYNFLKMAT
jgi:hypothetical protein